MNLLPKITVFMMMLILALSIVIAQEEATEFTAEPGITPDSPFYFIDTLFENVGNNPEKALQYKEEKLAELKVMAAEKKTDAATIALKKAQEYGVILEKEVTPAMQTAVSENAAAIEAVLTQASTDLPELGEKINEKKEQEQRITLAAEISTKIKQLCDTLSKLDAQQYAQNCKTGKDAPQWQKKHDQELTAEQQKHAKIFAEKMIECMETQGKTCDCEGMGVKKWTEICSAQQELKQRCDAQEEDACKAMMEQGSIDMFDYLPDYLYPVMQNLMKKFSQAQNQQYEQWEGKEEYISARCKEAGISSAKECAQYMKDKYKEFKGEWKNEEQFEFNEEMFMEGCIKYESKELCEKKAGMMKRGEFSSDNTRFGPGPCTDKGITSMEECRQYMEENFEKTSEGAYVMPAGQPARIGEFGRDCHAVKDLSEKARCFEDYYNLAKEKAVQPTQPVSTPGTAMYPSGMEEWQRSYYDRWMKAATEEEHTAIKMEMSEEMQRRNEEYKKEEYKYEEKQYIQPGEIEKGNEQYKKEDYGYKENKYPTPSTIPAIVPREETGEPMIIS